MKRSYSVAIRTLGLAGEKYLKTLQSIEKQTIKPTNIFVYLAIGYKIPKETIGIEKYIYVEKGMIAQRALPYDNINDEWILMLDDDMQLPPKYVESIMGEIERNECDCVSADLFHPHLKSNLRKLFNILDFHFPFYSKKWGIIIGWSGRFHYNNNPIKHFYQSQSGAGGCVFVRKEAFRYIHFEDELWMDKFGYPLGEDQIFHYKLYKNGWKLFTYYDSGLINLDAATGGKVISKERYENNTLLQFVIWHRTLYSFNRMAIIPFVLKTFMAFFVCVLLVFKTRKFYFLSSYIMGLARGLKYVNSTDYKKLNSFIIK